MPRRGPSPQPTAFKLLRGNPGKRRLNRREPQPAKELPRCPAWLDEEGKRVWKQIVPQLAAMGVIGTIDTQAIVRYCQLWVRWRRAEEFLSKHGDVFAIKDEEGKIKYLQQFPQAGIANQLAMQLMRLEQEFGMTASSRTRLHVETGQEQDEFESFLKSNRA